MAIIAENKGGTSFELLPAGNYIARCYSMVHIGTNTEDILGQKKELNKVRITWELPTELKVFKQENGEQPHVISKEYTLSMHEKAALRAMLQSWRGKAFTEVEAEKFDISKLLGVPCMLNVIHKPAKNGNTYLEISGVTPLPRGFVCPPQINKTFEFSVLDFNQEKFETLTEFLQNKIKTSKEYNNLQNHSEVSDVAEQIEQTDDLPF